MCVLVCCCCLMLLVVGCLFVCFGVALFFVCVLLMLCDVVCCCVLVCLYVVRIM